MRLTLILSEAQNPQSYELFEIFDGKSGFTRINGRAQSIIMQSICLIKQMMFARRNLYIFGNLNESRVA